ncbi:hypothetical protein ACJJIE_09940 [Microbulbifer sp. TRSA001]|uniref:hypothetical protein n=1 Tax=Microbulbifer sp. TRSA001 TaxID=3243381 RepID=UPI00403A1B5D
MGLEPNCFNIQYFYTAVRIVSMGVAPYDLSLVGVQNCFQNCYKDHGAEVGANSPEQYLRKAEGFKQNLRGASKSNVNGFTSGVVRFSKNGKYINLAPDGRIVSFGLK